VPPLLGMATRIYDETRVVVIYIKRILSCQVKRVIDQKKTRFYIGNPILIIKYKILKFLSYCQGLRFGRNPDLINIPPRCTLSLMPEPLRGSLSGGLVSFLPQKTFTHPLFKRALIHRSFADSDNESLEFLGDAILTFFFADELLERQPTREEGELSKLRSSLVSTAALAEKAILLGLPEKLYIDKGAEKAGIRSNPRVLAGTFEAVVAALYKIDGLDFAADFLRKVFAVELDEIAKGIYKNEDPKSHLQEYSQKRSGSLPLYDLLETTGPPHKREFFVRVLVDGKEYGEGRGSTRREAEKDAAIEALRKLGLL